MIFLVPITIPQEDVLLLRSREFAIEEIARFFSVPVAELEDLKKRKLIREDAA